MTISIPHVPPLRAYVRELPGVFYLTSEVADALDLSPATLRRLAGREAGMGPSHEAYFGRIRVDLYDDDAVARLARFVASHRDPRGRPRVWDDGQRRARRSGHCAAGYYRRRAAVLRRRGDDDGAQRAEQRVDVLRARLRESYPGDVVGDLRGLRS